MIALNKAFESSQKKCWLLLMAKVVKLQLLFAGQFYERKMIYNHQGRKVNL